MRTLNYKTRFIDLASEINSAMPDFVVEKTARALNDDRKAVNGSRILVVGVAYKKDIDDMRESPALDVMRLLEDRGATVAYHDPHVPQFRENGHVFHGVELTDAELCVSVTDAGCGPARKAEAPDLQRKLAGQQSPRGWGLFLIKSLVDEVEFSSTSEGNLVRMVIHLDR
jgi:hypothetical protein